MIYIITENSDISTNKVISYLIGSGKEFIRLNTNASINLSFSIIDNNISFQLNNKVLNKKDTFWIRRGHFNFIPNLSIQIDKQIRDYLFKEENSLNKSLELYLKEEYNIIGSYLYEVENYKLTHLLLAKQCGLNIPSTLITNNKNELLSFFNKYDTVISKALRYSPVFKFNDYALNAIGTFRISKEHINKLDDIFAPVLLQNEIEKKIEVRVFYFKEKIFSMAIFSQLNKESKIDCRNKNSKKETRYSPFKLPIKIKKQIIEFMKTSGLDTGSIDLILTKNDEYFFLEVNPQGQFDWVSENCNYYIEKFIADQLS